jgi:single-strand DNA-binding protein
MAGDTTITIVGNLVDDPELRFTASGVAVANFRVASTPRAFDRQTNEWKDGESLFLSCSVWRQYAENVAESLTKGTRVIVTGRLKQRSYETNNGEKRTVSKLTWKTSAQRCSPAKISKVSCNGAGGGGGFDSGSTGRSTETMTRATVSAAADEPPF